MRPVARRSCPPPSSGWWVSWRRRRATPRSGSSEGGRRIALLGPDAVSLGGSEYLWVRQGVARRRAGPARPRPRGGGSRPRPAPQCRPDWPPPVTTARRGASPWPWPRAASPVLFPSGARWPWAARSDWTWRSSARGRRESWWRSRWRRDVGLRGPHGGMGDSLALDRRDGGDAHGSDARRTNGRGRGSRGPRGRVEERL